MLKEHFVSEVFMRVRIFVVCMALMSSSVAKATPPVWDPTIGAVPECADDFPAAYFSTSADNWNYWDSWDAPPHVELRGAEGQVSDLALWGWRWTDNIPCYTSVNIEVTPNFTGLGIVEGHIGDSWSFPEFWFASHEDLVVGDPNAIFPVPAWATDPVATSVFIPEGAFDGEVAIPGVPRVLVGALEVTFGISSVHHALNTGGDLSVSYLIDIVEAQHCACSVSKLKPIVGVAGGAPTEFAVSIKNKTKESCDYTWELMQEEGDANIPSLPDSGILTIPARGEMLIPADLTIDAATEATSDPRLKLTVTDDDGHSCQMGMQSPKMAEPQLTSMCIVPQKERATHLPSFGTGGWQCISTAVNTCGNGNEKVAAIFGGVLIPENANFEGRGLREALTNANDPCSDNLYALQQARGGLPYGSPRQCTKMGEFRNPAGNVVQPWELSGNTDPMWDVGMDMYTGVPIAVDPGSSWQRDLVGRDADCSTTYEIVYTESLIPGSTASTQSCGLFHGNQAADQVTVDQDMQIKCFGTHGIDEKWVSYSDGVLTYASGHYLDPITGGVTFHVEATRTQSDQGTAIAPQKEFVIGTSN